MIRSIHNDGISLTPQSPESPPHSNRNPTHKSAGIKGSIESNRSKMPSEVVQAAEGMETMFIDYMMKVMRQTVPKNEMDLESPATEIYRGMLDSEYAQNAARHGGIGLADQIIDYLSSRGYHLPEGQGVPMKEKP